MSIAEKFNIPPALFETIRKMNAEETEYQMKVKALMKKKGITSLGQLSPEEKKDFFNTLDSMHKAKNEEVKPDVAKSFPASGVKKHTAPKGVSTMPKDKEKAKGQPAGSLRKEEVELEEGYEKVVLDFLDKKGFDSPNFKNGNLYVSKRELAGVKKALQNPTGFNAKDLKVIAEEVELDEAKKPVSKDDVTKLLIKYGNNPQSAKKMVDAEFASAVKRHPEASASKIAEVIRSVAEEVELDEVKVGDKVHLGLKQRGGSGMRGTVHKIEGDTIHVNVGKEKFGDRIVKGSMKNVTKEEVELEEAKGKLTYTPKPTEYGVFPDSKKEFGKIFQSKDQALAHIKKFGGKLVVLDQHGRRIKEEVEIDEGKSGTGYELYHKDFSSAMAHAYDFAKKKYNIEIDPLEIDRNVAMGPRKPSSGKANAYRLLDKTGKKAIQVQVTNLDNKRYELNMYKEDLDEERDPPFTPDKPKKNPGVVPGKRGVGPSVAKHLAKMAMKKQMDKKKTMKEDQELNESHFKVGQRVECIASGMKGTVTKVDPEEKGKYYTVKQDSGKMMKYAPDELKALGTNEAKDPKTSMKRAALSMSRAQEVVRHQKEIGSIRRKREALRNSFDPVATVLEAYKKSKMKKEATAKDNEKNFKSGDKLSGKTEPIEINPELKEQKT